MGEGGYVNTVGSPNPPSFLFPSQSSEPSLWARPDPLPYINPKATVLSTGWSKHMTTQRTVEPHMPEINQPYKAKCGGRGVNRIRPQLFKSVGKKLVSICQRILHQIKGRLRAVVYMHDAVVLFSHRFVCSFAPQCSFFFFLANLCFYANWRKGYIGSGNYG